MSQETIEWLNINTLIGFTESRGSAWHMVEAAQGEESNHYPGAVPLEDVKRRLFNWLPVEGKLVCTYVDGDGNTKQITDKERKAILRPDTGDIFGIFKNGYQIHSYEEWLLNQVALILDDELQIGSAGLLRKGAQAWVQVEVDKSIKTPEGVEFRPHLLAATSLDGTLATSYSRSVVNTVCDNTMSAALISGKDQGFKVKHTRYSHIKLQDAKDALAIIHETGDAFSEQVAELCNMTVTEDQWTKFLDEINPIPADESRGRTVALNKRDRLTGMWESDSRVSPWRGTAWGVIQCCNTYSTWENNVHGEDTNPDARQERNITRAIKGGVDELDSSTLSTLQAVLA